MTDQKQEQIPAEAWERAVEDRLKQHAEIMASRDSSWFARSGARADSYAIMRLRQDARRIAAEMREGE